jgi:leader peptidase (prepilin peptidase)/N-methyltransferase
MTFAIPDLAQLPLGIQIAAVLAIGFCIGSFLNVVIVRLPRGRSLISPSSRCGFCRSSLRSWTNIPVVSFLITGGRCSHCGYAYSIRYPIVEALTAVLFFSVYAVYGWTMATVMFSLFVAALLAMSFIDLEFRIIPDSISIGGWIVALVISLLNVPGYPLDFVSSLLGSIAGFAGFWILSRGYYFLTSEEGLGGGDIKLMGFIGAVLGIKGVITTILVGSLLGSVVGILFMVVYKKSKRFPIPFGPFLAVGALVAVYQLDLLWWAA